jgi:hypothetical protein
MKVFVIRSLRDSRDNLDDDPTFMDVDLAKTPVSGSAFQCIFSQHSIFLNGFFEKLQEEDFVISAKSPRFKSKLDRFIQRNHR